jgi:RepB DNA-primase from phage plasmid
MTPDLDQAAAFLAALDPDADRFTFQYFGERPGASVPARHMHGRLADLAPQLVAMNAAGAGIFVTVNRTNGGGRSAENVVALRSLFIDCDGPRARPLALTPSMSVETSPLRGHHYWLLVPGEPLDVFRDAQAALADYYGTDTTVTDRGRVLRIPGFAHMKGEPFFVRLIRSRGEKRYTIADVLAAHLIKPARETGTPRTTMPRTCAEIAYHHWSRRAPLTVGHRNRVAFRLALEGFRAGLDAAVIDAEVRAFCARSGIVAEADAVLRSARRAACVAAIRDDW